MKALLKNNQKKEYRFKQKELILYYPTNEQLSEIRQLVENDMKINNQLQSEFDLNLKSIRFIIREITSIGYEIDEYDDTVLQGMLDNGNRDLTLLLREIKTLIQEIVDDIFYDYIQSMKEINMLLNISTCNDELDKIQTKLNKFFKKNKLNVKFEDFADIQSNPEKLQKLINN
jgi:hypothetical protein